jgi:hypothetical protein
MPRPSLILLPFLLLFALPAAAAEARPAADQGKASRPLNLSLPRDLTQAPAPAGEESVLRNLRKPGEVADAPSARLPYGAGWESRHRDESGGSMGGAASAAPAGGGAGGGSRGR